jgi:hypothetical protein
LTTIRLKTNLLSTVLEGEMAHFHCTSLSLQPERK